MSQRLLFIIFLSVLFSANLFSQTEIFTGIVKDKKSHQPLAFVNIVSNNGFGATTNIDGKFELNINEKSRTLSFTYIGYEALSYQLEKVSDEHIFYLKSKTFNLNEVEVFPGINPAHRIIDSVLNNRALNDPAKIKEFSYISYDKMNITVGIDSLLTKDTVSLDTNQMEIRKFVEKQDIFLLETVTERKYLAPGLNQENVLATRVSGFKDPVIAFMISQMQSTSFYEPQITIFSKKYANPISNGSTNKYFFLIEDTSFTERGDTVFMISFRPKVKTKFEGMKGFLYINTHKWAVQNVKAQPPDDSTGIAIKIQQAYKLIEDQWFPYQLNTDIIFNNMSAGNGDTSFPLIGKGRSYIREINLKPGLKKKEFGFHEVEIEEGATRKKGEFWREYRVDSLTDREKETYRVIDSIGRAANFDKMATTVQTLLIGRIPIWIFDLDLDKFTHYNNYEGFYLGVGAHTNERFSKVIKTGGFWGYGFKDKTAKYGLDISLNLHKRSESVLMLDAYNKVTASGEVEFFEDKYQAWKTDNFYKFFVSRMNKTVGGEISYSFRLRPARDFKWNLGFSYNEKTAFEDYYFTSSDLDLKDPTTVFKFAQLKLGFKFAFREKIIETTKGQISLGSKYPVVWFNYGKGFKDVFGSEYDYNRFDLKIQKTHHINFIGDFTWRIMGGVIFGEIPASNLFDGNGTYRPFTLFAPFSFSTMRSNEFLSDRYAAIFLTHDFGELLFKFGNFKPQLLLLTNIAFGSLSNPQNHHNYEFNTLEKGYYESGFLVRKLLNLQIYDLGLGIMYRYGPYSLEDTYMNFAYKISLYYAF